MIRALFLMALALPALAETEPTFDSDLYFQSHALPRGDSPLELRPSAGLDFSHPYLSIYSVSAGAFWTRHPVIHPGLEVAGYFSRRRPSYSDLEGLLSDYGFHLKALAPQWSSVAILRLTPLSGLANLYSRGVTVVDLSLGLRGGVIHYPDTLAPLLGVVLDVSVGITPDVGIAAGLQWDVEKVGEPWESRVGFRMGPVIHL